MRRGQMEMVGFAMVIVILMICLMLYLSLSKPSTQYSQEAIIEASTYGKTLLTTMLETTLDTCGYPLATALRRCMVSPNVQCQGQDVCQAAHDAWVQMIEGTLGSASTSATFARNYQAKVVQGSDVLNPPSSPEFLLTPFPDTCNDNSFTYAAPHQPLFTAAGELTLIIDFCE